MVYLLPLAGLVLTYMALSENISFKNTVTGFLIAGLILVLLRPRRGSIRWQQIPIALLGLAAYILILFWDLIKSGIQVARIVVDPRLPIRQGIIRIPSESDSELGTAISAHWITLTPGELVVEIDDSGGMYTHCLNVEESYEDAITAQRRRNRIIRKIFDAKEGP